MNTSREGWCQGERFEASTEESTGSCGTSTSGKYTEASDAVLNRGFPFAQFASVTQVSTRQTKPTR